MRRLGLGLLLLVMGWAVQAAPAFEEGKDYTLITKPSAMPAGRDVQVQEFFWYGCPHCFHLLPVLDAWSRHQPAYVKLILVPAALTPVWQIDARAFYAAQIRGVVDKTHALIFNSIHQQNHTELVNDIPAIARFYEANGGGAHFADLMNSMVVLGKVNYAAEAARNYAIEGVPSLVIDGKYLVDYHAGEPDRMMKVVDYLVAQEHASKK